MGLLQGKVVGESIVVMDSFALPVQGTETRVNAQEAANEYMVEYISASDKARNIYHKTARTTARTDFYFLPKGWEKGKRDWMVSFSSWLWLLAVWYRRFDTRYKSKISRSFRCRRRMSSIFIKTK